jgi:hypothetical protein
MMQVIVKQLKKLLVVANDVDGVKTDSMWVGLSLMAEEVMVD